MSTSDIIDEKNLPEIAIIGSFCNFPKSYGLKEYWQNLMTGTECLTRYERGDLRTAGVPEEVLTHPDYRPVHGALADIAGFDADLFGISPGEAEIIDPQHRLFLEGSWAALEDAGIDPKKFEGEIGVFAGAGLNAYLLHALTVNPDAVAKKGDYLVLMSNDKDFLPTRVSYKLGLTGPSMNVSTACSTSLVAVDLACQNLLSYQCDVALAGGVSLQVPPHQGYIYEPGGTQSQDGCCRPFDKDGSGLVGGSGLGIVVLKRLEDALADRDDILAVIKGTAINNDGAQKAGFTAPSVSGQADVIAQAQANAGVDARTIGYVEAHGTGTHLGDPIEIQALSDAFGLHTDKRGFCWIGSAKSNLGHLDAAAGMAGLLKAAMVVKTGKIPPTLHFQSPNPEIDFENSPFRVADRLLDYPPTDYPRRAGVSSFGIGGTNAHVILEQPPEKVDRPSVERPVILPLSAKTSVALRDLVCGLADHLGDVSDINLSDVATTLQVGRRSLDHRIGIVAVTAADAVDQLRKATQNPLADGGGQVAFMFPGQGSHYAGMARGLYRDDPHFRQEMDDLAEAFLPYLSYDVRDVLGLRGAECHFDLTQTRWAQPAVFAVEYALARCFMACGVQPDVMIGHSLGEIVAACLAGVMSLKNACEMVVERARLMQEMPAGAMMAVSMDQDDLLPFLGDGINLAAVNGPERCVVAGPCAALEKLQAHLEARGKHCRFLATSHAFHSAMMDPMLARFTHLMENMDLRPGEIAVMSNVSGEYLHADQATDPRYWADHIRQTVQFGKGLETAHHQGVTCFIEVGPGRALSQFVKAHKFDKVKTFSPMGAQTPDNENGDFLTSCAALWQVGIDLEWAYFAREDAYKVSLPPYPFQHKPYWIEPDRRPKAALEGGLWSVEFQSTPSLGDRDITDPRGEVVLYFAGHCADLSEEVEKSGCHLVRFEQGAVGAVTPEFFKDVITDLQAQGIFPDRVIYDWQGTTPDHDDFYLPIYLLQALENANGAQTAYRFSLITQGLFDLYGTETGNVSQSLAQGVMRATMVEFPHIAVQMIDEVGTDARTLWREICVEKLGRDPVCLLRGQARWHLTFNRLQGDCADGLKHGGSYILAGGLSGIGFEIAQKLAADYHANLMICGQTALPETADFAPLTTSSGGADLPESLIGFEWQDRFAEARQVHPVQTLDHFDGFVEQVNRLCGLYLCDYLRRSGGAGEGRAPISIADLRARVGLMPKFNKLFDYILKVLEQDGILTRTGEEVVFLHSLNDIEAPDNLFAQLCADFPEFEPIFKMFKHCMDQYPAALSGQTDAVGVIFPGGGDSLWDQATRQIPEHTLHKVYGTMVRDMVQTILAQHSGDHPLRILEIGGGAGVLTDLVAPDLKGANVEYTFTDISKSFVLKAEQKYRQDGLDFMKFTTLDISKPVEKQGFKSGYYDLILELDCVHATTDMRATLGHCRDLLADDGVMVFVESVQTYRWVNLPLGLLDGWWLFEDEDLRTDSPLMSLAAWDQLMTESGFSAFTYPQDPSAREQVDSGLIVAQKSASFGDGVEKISRLKQLEGLGATVHYMACDMENRDDLQAVVDRTLDKFGCLDGFLQTAAGSHSGPILTKQKSDTENEFRAKVTGSQNVAAVLAPYNPDFIALSSSHCAYDAGFGDAEYSAANFYVDRFCHRQKRLTGQNFIAVNWDRWRNVGMAQAFEALIEKRLGVGPAGGLTVEEGFAAFKTLTAHAGNWSQVIVSATDFNEKIANQQDVQPAQLEQAERDLDPVLHPPKSPTEQTIAQIWAEALGLGQISRDDEFYQLGGDSLIAVKVVSRLRSALERDVTVDMILDYPVLSELADHLDLLNQAYIQPAMTQDDVMEEGVL